MKRNITFFILLFLSISATSFAQIRDVPAEVTSAFTKQYPAAEAVTYRDNLINFAVHFTMDGEKSIAKYDSNGEWKVSEKITEIASFPQAVQDGFKKSKYAADWKVAEVTIITMPKDVESFRIKVEKGELQKKNLYFNKAGRLTKDGLTL